MQLGDYTPSDAPVNAFSTTCLVAIFLIVHDVVPPVRVVHKRHGAIRALKAVAAIL